MEASVRLVKEEKKEDVKEPAERAATERLLDALQGKAKAAPSASNPFEALFGGQTQQPESSNDTTKTDRAQLRRLLELGELEDRVIEVELEEKQTVDLFQGQGMEGL
ncbi:HslU--HslV peptidase ATPase subunit, partial [Brevibacillus sp. SIMBA_076]